MRFLFGVMMAALSWWFPKLKQMHEYASNFQISHVYIYKIVEVYRRWLKKKYMIFHECHEPKISRIVIFLITITPNMSIVSAKENVTWQAEIRFRENKQHIRTTNDNNVECDIPISPIRPHDVLWFSFVLFNWNVWINSILYKVEQ